MNKRKIFNDPVYGFITIPYEIIFDLIEHPYFQRLRRIRQLGLTHLVYPGALHTRFHHALGALHLMGDAVEAIRSKGHIITEEEAKGACIAILLHDVGHAPFSHALENSIVTDVSHEQISELYMNALNKEFDGALSLAIAIFKGAYHKKFLHQFWRCCRRSMPASWPGSRMRSTTFPLATTPRRCGCRSFRWRSAR